MENFVYEYPTKVLFGRGAAREHLGKALSAYGPNVMLAYGGGSIRRNGVYDEMMEILGAADKTVTEFHGIMSNPTYAKVQEGAALAREKGVDFILAVGGGSVIDCCKVVAAQAVLEFEVRPGDRLPGPPDRAPAGGLHRLQPRSGAGGSPSPSLPGNVPKGSGEIRPVCRQYLGHFRRGKVGAGAGYGRGGGSGGLYPGMRPAHPAGGAGYADRPLPTACPRDAERNRG